MRHRIAMALVLMFSGVIGTHAQESSTFQVPRPHDSNRYEAGWNKNPFTLKTEAAAIESVSFAKDLAIGSYYGSSDNPVVVVVNTKTGERVHLQQGKTAANGMVLKTFKHGSGRKDAVAEVNLGPETCQLRYNDDYVRQIAASAGAGAMPQGSTLPGKPALPQIPQGQQPSLGGTGRVSVTGQATSQATQRVPSSSGTPVAAAATIPLPGMVSSGVGAKSVQPLPRAVTSMANSNPAAPTIPVPSRIRLVTPPASTSNGTPP